MIFGWNSQENTVHGSRRCNQKLECICEVQVGAIIIAGILDVHCDKIGMASIMSTKQGRRGEGGESPMRNRSTKEDIS
jgi:hypothetical protein